MGVREIRGNKTAGDALLHARWITAWELVASRGDHDLCEGKALEGKFRNGLGVKQSPGTRTCLEIAEGLRKPGSETRSRRDGPLHNQGGSFEDAVEGHETSVKVSSDRQVGQSRKVVN